jgi:hypothetical protein
MVSAFPDFSVALAGLDHGHADAILDAGKGIEKFAFDQDGGSALGNDPIEANQRRAADRVDDAVEYAALRFKWHRILR